MSHRLARLKHWTLAGLVALLIIGPGIALAKTTGVAADAALESGPCYQALVDKNAETPSTAPNRELGDACRVENGDIDKAWARVLRLWGSDHTEIPDYDSYMRADAAPAGTISLWLAIASTVLMYGVAATPMRSVAALTAGGAGTGLLAAESIVALLLRGALGLALLALFQISAIAFAGCSLLVVLLIQRLMVAKSSSTPVESGLDAGSEGALSVFVADIINDLAGAAVGLLGLALFANHNIALFGCALLIAVVLSVRPLRLVRRLIVVQPIAATGITALLAASAAVYLLNEPLVVPLLSGLSYLGVIVPIVFGLAVVALGWRTWGKTLPPAGA